MDDQEEKPSQESLPKAQIKITQPLSTSADKTKPLVNNEKGNQKPPSALNLQDPAQENQHEKKPMPRSKKKIIIVVAVVLVVIVLFLLFLLALGGSDVSQETQQEPVVIPSNTPRPTSEAELIPRSN